MTLTNFGSYENASWMITLSLTARLLSKLIIDVKAFYSYYLGRIDFFTIYQPVVCYLNPKHILDCKNNFLANEYCINNFSRHKSYLTHSWVFSRVFARKLL